jgi:hypothetical protein
MTPASVCSVLLAASLCLSGLAGLRWHTAAPITTSSPSAVMALRTAPSPPSGDSLTEAEDLIATNDPFRLSNSAPTVRYDPANDGVNVSNGNVALPAPRPTLVLRAIVGGPPWRAVIDGIPGQPAGAIVEQGNKFDKLVVGAVTRDSVVVKGSDTSWVLSFRKRS